MEDSLSGVHVALLRWWRENARDFPWRSEAITEYEALMTEVLLWKTSARQVATQWRPFFTAFPHVRALAEATTEEVEVLTRPLGFRKRAELLVAAAREITRRGTIVPVTKRELLELPGVGEYAASAFLCFHHGRDEAIVDANVTRVVTRLTGCSPRLVRGVAKCMLPTGWSREWNYGLLDLGALVCGTKPRCGECPLSSTCFSASGGEQT